MEQFIKSVRNVAALIMVVATLASCQKSPEATPIRGGGTAPRAGGEQGGTSTTSTGLVLNGFVWSNDQAFFLEQTKAFLAGSLDPQYVGWVSATAQNNTGVFFGGRVTFTDNRTLQNVNGAQINANSELIVSVFDMVPNQANLPPLPPTYFKQLDIQQSYVSGNQAKLVFYDSRGFVEMTGQISGEYFDGDFYFDTQVQWDGTEGHAGILGSFRVPKCQFFRCN